MKRKLLWLALRAVPGDDARAADPPPPDPTLDDLLGEPEPEPAPIDEPGENPELVAAKREQKRLADELEAERRARRAAEERSAPPPAPRPVAADPEYEAEERELAQARANGATADQLSWIQWKVDQSRRARATQRNSEQALATSRDAADRADFARLEITKPATFKRYAARVEQAVADALAKGLQAPPRAAILRLLVGDDMVNGTIKPKAPKAAAAAGEAARVDRATMPRPRSDVDAKRRLSEREARLKRLENQII